MLGLLFLARAFVEKANMDAGSDYWGRIYDYTRRMAPSEQFLESVKSLCDTENGVQAIKDTIKDDVIKIFGDDINLEKEIKSIKYVSPWAVSNGVPGIRLSNKSELIFSIYASHFGKLSVRLNSDLSLSNKYGTDKTILLAKCIEKNINNYGENKIQFRLITPIPEKKTFHSAMEEDIRFRNRAEMMAFPMDGKRHRGIRLW